MQRGVRRWLLRQWGVPVSRAFIVLVLAALPFGCMTSPVPEASGGAGTGGVTTDAGADVMLICEFVIRVQDPSCPELPNAIITHCPDGGPCRFVACAPNFADCDSDLTDGCEIDIGNDPSNCGACGQVCPAPLGTCVNMGCQ